MAQAPAKKKKLVKGRHASQIKRDRQNKKRHERNVSIKSSLKTAIKKVRQAVVEKKFDQALAVLQDTSKVIYKAVSKGVLHKNNASRNVSKLSLLVNSLKS